MRAEGCPGTVVKTLSLVTSCTAQKKPGGMEIMYSTKNDTLEVKFGLGFGARAAADCYLTRTNQPAVTEAEDEPQPLAVVWRRFRWPRHFCGACLLITGDVI